jgi:hypothetical protein
MPPLGTVLPDTQALDLMSAWIAGLSARQGQNANTVQEPQRSGLADFSR